MPQAKRKSAQSAVAKPRKAPSTDARKRVPQASKQVQPSDIHDVTKTMHKELKSTIKAMDSALTDPAPGELVDQLNNIDFRLMIGGPLQAAIDAQVASSMATINFIKTVGFNDDGTIKTVNFKYNKTKADGTTEGADIDVPFLAMLPIPSLRIDTVDINFNAKLNSVQTTEVKSELKVGVEAKGGWGPVSFKVTASYQRSSTMGYKVEKEFTLNVKVKAVQDEIPAGLEKILNLLGAS